MVSGPHDVVANRALATDDRRPPCDAALDPDDPLYFATFSIARASSMSFCVTPPASWVLSEKASFV